MFRKKSRYEKIVKLLKGYDNAEGYEMQCETSVYELILCLLKDLEEDGNMPVLFQYIIPTHWDDDPKMINIFAEYAREFRNYDYLAESYSDAAYVGWKNFIGEE